MVRVVAGVTMVNQDVFCDAFAVEGSMTRAAAVANIDITTPYKWMDNDIHGFREKLQLAQLRFRESLQDIAMDRIREPQGNRGSDGLLSHMLNANWPEKYRQDAKPVDDAALVVARQTRDAIRELAKQELVARGELVEGKVVEAEEAEGKE
jgi:hypothetical protein